MHDFKGEFSESSIPATVYSVWHLFFHKNLLADFTIKGKFEGKLYSKDDESD
jgi:hypothetical protein